MELNGHINQATDVDCPESTAHENNHSAVAAAEVKPEVVADPAPTEPSNEVQEVRETWASKVDFILSAVGFAVGFGNIWRFPYLCYSNGGGAFLIPYVFMMTFLGMPLFYLELALGQYASLGPISVWRLCPLFKGIGYTMIGMNVLIAIYYNVILALSVFYFFASFTSELPWATCNKWWNVACSENAYAATLSPCYPSGDNASFPVTNSTSVYSTVTMCSLNVTNASRPLRSPAEEYWQYYVLSATNETNIGNIGGVRWHLALCLLFAWIIVFLCIVRGIKTSGKVVYFTATFPYVVLFILLIRAVTLPGAGTGIAYYLYPDFTQLGRVKVWKDAAVQILFSLGPGFGNLIMLGSYNKFNNNCNRDAVAVTLINCGTSLFAGFVIFGILGFMAQRHQVSVDVVVDKGPGLAFVAYPEAVSLMPGAPFWAICFFFMLITLGLDSQFVGIECIITALMDEYSLIRRWKKTATLIACCVLYLVGLPCVTQGGMFVIELIDKFTTTYPLLIATMLEAIVLMWIYGFRRMSSDIYAMIGHRPNYFWLSCWMVISPLILLFIIIFASVNYTPPVYSDIMYPPWAEGVGWLLAALLLLPLPVWAIYSVCRCIGSWQKVVWVLKGNATIQVLNLRSLVTPDEQWGPALEQHRPPKSFSDIAAETTDAAPDAGFAVAYHEGRCFVTSSAYYSQSLDDSHI